MSKCARQKLIVICDNTRQQKPINGDSSFLFTAIIVDNLIALKYLPVPAIESTANAVIRLSQTVPNFINHIVYFHSFYITLPLRVYLWSTGIYTLGTIRSGPIPNCKLPSDKDKMVAKAGKGFGRWIYLKSTWCRLDNRFVKGQQKRALGIYICWSVTVQNRFDWRAAVKRR